MYWAKSFPKETIREHTDRLLTELHRLKKSYGDRITDVGDSFWRLLELAVKFHDIGKANIIFQNKIRQVLGEPSLPVSLASDEIPHNYLSVALIPFSQLKLKKEEYDLLVDAVGYHHERNKTPRIEEIVKFVKESGLITQIKQIYEHMGLPYDPEPLPVPLLRALERNRKDATEKKMRSDPQYRKKHVLLKGFLHRLDHAASAYVKVEEGVEENIGSKAEDFMLKQGYALHPAQQFARDNQNHHLIIIASTGSGKTEASLLWLGNSKGFITLPLRVSLNAMFSRLHSKDGVSIEHLGLLHSGSFDYLTSLDHIDGEETYTISRQLSQKITLTTIDQILKFPFLYRGFEKELAAMAYSKVVIDEIQAYEPNIAAMLIKAIEYIDEIGGQVMIMTATFPKLYLEAMQEIGLFQKSKWKISNFPNDHVYRHKIELHPCSVMAHTGEILEKGLHHKVLVIVNTVDQAIAVYNKLLAESNDQISVHLLHARFTRAHKALLEEKITNFAKSGWHNDSNQQENGIWVTTQIVEASLDVDFDYLYTEMCPLDSLFQRMGRCYRVREYSGEVANVHVYTDEISGVGTVYDKHIVHLSVDDLGPYQNQFLLESTKMKLVDQLYSMQRLQGSEFLKKFQEALRWFENLQYFDRNAAEAQALLRDIRSRSVIPFQLRDEVLPVIEQFRKEKDQKQRRLLRNKIESMSVTVRERKLYQEQTTLIPFEIKGLEYLSWIREEDVDYDFDPKEMSGKGLVFNKKTSIF